MGTETSEPRERAKPDFRAYHKSITAELAATKNRVRHLIGGSHWGTDGSHKEVVLRVALRAHIAESLHVETGFVCGPESTSHQIDILISHRDKPTLFRDGELSIVTPDAVAGIIEVKTACSGVVLEQALGTLADDVEMVRANGNPCCQAGLFIYEGPRNVEFPVLQRLLEPLQRASRGDPNRVINWVAAGRDVFVRHWHHGRDITSPVGGAVWHSYHLESLAHAYFISNVAWDTCPNTDDSMQFAWFPAEGGKEPHRTGYIPLGR